MIQGPEEIDSLIFVIPVTQKWQYHTHFIDVHDEPQTTELACDIMWTFSLCQATCLLEGSFTESGLFKWSI